MEINPSNTAARACYEDVIWGGRDNDVGQATSKSYSCTFCKRGFSNAQALGGHMNIHRKDRARLRESSSEYDQTLVLSAEEATTKKDESSSFDHDQEKNSAAGSNKRPWSFSELEDDHSGTCSPRKKEGTNAGEMMQFMTLFVETSSGDHHEGCGSRGKDVVNVEASTQIKDHLDLELRLGIDCQETSRKDVG